MKASTQRVRRLAGSALLAIVSTGVAAVSDVNIPFRVERNVAYLPPDRLERADLYIPDVAQPGNKCPGIVVIHGGGWIVGDKASGREVSMCSNLAAHGYVCMSINYALATSTYPSFPTNIQDCKQAVRWLRKNAERYSVDADHIGAVGGSAGGHLTALLAVSGPEVGLDPDVDSEYSCRVQAAMSMYGACLSSWEHGVPPSTFNNMTMFASSRTADPDLWNSGLPILHLTTDDPPFLLLHGDSDQTVPLFHSIRFNAEAVRVGLSSDLIIVEGAGHSFNFMPEGYDLRPDVFAFFDTHLKQPTATAGEFESLAPQARRARNAAAARWQRTPELTRFYDLLGRAADARGVGAQAGVSVRCAVGCVDRKAPGLYLSQR